MLARPFRLAALALLLTTTSTTASSCSAAAAAAATVSARPRLISSAPRCPATPLSLSVSFARNMSSTAGPTMRAIVVEGGAGDASKLRLIDTYAKPTPKADEILIKVHAFGLNRMDILQREGKYPPPPGASELIGVEVAGIVEAVGDQVGDQVFGLMGGGAYAEYAVMHKNLAMKIPTGFSFEQAASIPEAFFTAFQALRMICDLEPGQDVLIHAGASGVGVAAIQIAKMTKAKRIFTTAGSESKVNFCKSLGADYGINYKTESFKNVIANVTNGRGVDVVVDFVGANYWDDNLSSLAMDGRMVMLAFLGGASVPNCNLAPILRKRLRIEGSTLRSRSLQYQTLLRNRFVDEILPFIESGDIKPIIDTVHPWTMIQEAHKHMESNQNQGKIIMTID